MTIQLLYSPFPALDPARLAARALLEQKLVACCNILPAGESHYIWQGELTVAPEVILIAKTTPEKLEAARELLGSLHPYECPAILGFTADANSSFASWVGAQTV